MISITSSDEWKNLHQGGAIGLLEVSNVNNKGSSAELNQRKKETEELLRTRYNGFSRADFLALPVMSDYEKYYKRFDKTYHVQLQIESIVSKGKNLPNVSPLVDANFVAEVETLILTAGHDVSKLIGPVIIDVSREGDTITQMNGATKPVRSGDMIMRDAEAICCSIIYGQDNRSPISSDTTHVLYVAYAPPGVSSDSVKTQLVGIQKNIECFCPTAVIEQLRIISA